MQNRRIIDAALLVGAEATAVAHLDSLLVLTPT